MKYKVTALILIFCLVGLYLLNYKSDANSSSTNYIVVESWYLGRLQTSPKGEGFCVLVKETLSRDEVIKITESFIKRKRYKNIIIYIFNESSAAKQFLNSEVDFSKSDINDDILRHLLCTYGVMLYESDLPKLDQIIWRQSR